jgi:hypothetical protein
MEFAVNSFPATISPAIVEMQMVPQAKPCLPAFLTTLQAVMALDRAWHR